MITPEELEGEKVAARKRRRRQRALDRSRRANWLFNFLVSLTFLLLIAELGRSGTFWLYGAIGVFTWIFCYKLIPETKDKPLEEITEVFEARAARHEGESGRDD